MQSNLFLQDNLYPPFSDFKPEDIIPAVKNVLAQNRAALSVLLQQPEMHGWDNLFEPLTQMQNRLKSVWSPIEHLNRVKNTSDWRAAYEACLPELTQYALELAQSRPLYDKIQAIADSPEFSQLPQSKKSVVELYLRDFKLAGVHLAGEAKQQFNQLKQDLEKLSTQFSNHVMDATDNWWLLIEDVNELSGVPENMLTLMRANATEKGQAGYRVTLDFPCYYAIMQYADNSRLRETIYEAYVTRASDVGPHQKAWDNTPIMQAILEKRQQLAHLLGYQNYAELSLAKKMAPSCKVVEDFLETLVKKAKPKAQKEWEALQRFAQEMDGKATLNPWDVLYYSEKLQQSEYAISPEILKPYFPLTQVMQGFFKLLFTLFGIQCRQQMHIQTWHPSVEIYEVIDKKGQTQGWFYIDLFARPHKQGGAWMDSLRDRVMSRNIQQMPMAYVTCNFEPPAAGKPALLTHDELLTLFHEFGHAFHHLLTQINEIDVSGINGVAWDAVELPSQWMENFCWKPEILQEISGHVETQESLPIALIEKLLAAKNFQAGMQLVRQLEFAIFDLHLHQASTPVNIASILQSVRASVSVVPIAPYNRFQHSFTHIFSGGYAAGYYGYLWAEVLSADAFSVFESEGVSNPAIGERFLNTILGSGGAYPMMILFEKFCGRPLSMDAFLKGRDLSS